VLKAAESCLHPQLAHWTVGRAIFRSEPQRLAIQCLCPFVVSLCAEIAIAFSECPSTVCSRSPRSAKLAWTSRRTGFSASSPRPASYSDRPWVSQKERIPTTRLVQPPWLMNLPTSRGEAGARIEQPCARFPISKTRGSRAATGGYGGATTR